MIERSCACRGMLRDWFDIVVLSCAPWGCEDVEWARVGWCTETNSHSHAFAGTSVPRHYLFLAADGSYDGAHESFSRLRGGNACRRDVLQRWHLVHLASRFV